MVDLQQLLDLAVREEQYALTAHQNRVAFYSSLISVLFAATVAGALRASAASHYLLLVAGPALVFALCVIGRDGTARFYRRFREAVSARAKLEQALGLTLPLENPEHSEPYWSGEPLIPPRYLKSRHKQESSEEFIDSGLNTGYQAVTIKLFLLFQIVAVAVACGLVAMAFSAALEKSSEQDRCSRRATRTIVRPLMDVDRGTIVQAAMARFARD